VEDRERADHLAQPAVELSLSSFRVEGKTLETGAIELQQGSPAIVLLHEALGSVSHWKHFPARLAHATGCNVLLYSRPGHGQSEGPVEKRGIAYIERQATVVLRAMLEHFHVEQPVLFGHSEGALIAMAFAAAFPAGPRALILESPVFAIEPTTVNGMRNARDAWGTTDLRRRLQRHHRDVDAVFQAFIEPWGPREFGSMDFREHLGAIRCPTLIIQGDRDEYGTTKQARILSEHIPGAQPVIMHECGHTPHRERTQAVLDHVARFLSRTDRCSSSPAR
jgi:pimeloyl-ACP methyl ester carboxylesterase